MAVDAAKERQIPIGLMIAGLVLFVVAGLFRAGATGTAMMLAALGVVAVIGVGLMLLAAFITASITSVRFGDLRGALLKFAGIYLFSSGVSAVLGGGWLGALISIAVFFSLLVWLFELETPYAVAFTLIYLVVSWVTALAVAGAFAAR
jgi:hypothetical protein